MNRPTPRLATALSALALVSLGAPRLAQGVTTGAFPNLEPWPSALALSGIPDALGEGVEAALENPTGMLATGERGVAFSHASLYTGGLVHHQTVAICLPRFGEDYAWTQGNITRERGRIRSAFGLAVTNLSGDLPGTDSYGELQVSLAYARHFMGMPVGLRFRLLQARSTVDGSGGKGYAFDLGTEGHILGCRIGAVGYALSSNIHWQESLDGPLPTRVDVGAERPVGGGLTLLAGATYYLSGGSPRRLAFAAQWHLPGTPLSLQTGPGWRDSGTDQQSELSSGASILVGRLTFDYAIRTGPAGLGDVQRFGFRLSMP